MNIGKQTLQWYIYEPIENWFSKPIKKICHNEDALIYDNLSYPTYASFKKIKYVEINCDFEQASRVLHHVNKMIKECQYKMPWINELTYFIEDNMHHVKKWDEIKAKLVEKEVLNYLLDKQKLPIDWFGKKSIMVYEFSPRLSDLQRAEVELIFRFSVDGDAKDNPIFISRTLPYHRANMISSPMYIRPLECFGNTYLKTLSLEDILSLEMAHNDHRFEIDRGSDFMYYIDCELRLRLKFLKKPQSLKCVLINEFILPEVLCYFINKYHKYYQKFYIPNILTMYDRVSMSRTYGVKVLNKQNYNITINFKFNDPEEESFVMNYKTFGNRVSNLNVNNPYIPRYYKFDCIVERKFVQLPELTAPIYNPNEYIEIYIKNQHHSGSKYINKVLKSATNQFRNHERGESKLILDQLDFQQISYKVFRNAYDTFSCIEFINTKPTSHVIDILNVCKFARTSKINFKDCFLTNQDVIDLSLRINLDILPHIKISGNNYFDASVYFEITLAHNNVAIDSSLDQLVPETLPIPKNIFPNFCMFKNKYDWRGATLKRKFVDDHIIKYDLVKKTKVVDLWYELNGIETNIEIDGNQYDYCYGSYLN